LPLEGSLTPFKVWNRFLVRTLYVTSHAYYIHCSTSLQRRLILVITAAANGAGGVIRGRKEGLKAWGDNDEISDADVRTSSAFKIEMALAFLKGDGRIVQIFSPVFLLYFTIHHFPLRILGCTFLLAF
jgi:hypothetical protein